MTLAVVVALLASWSPTLLWIAVFAHVNANSPVAVVVIGGVIAGLFSIVNTILNIRLIKIATANRDELQQVKQVTDKVKVRKGDLPDHLNRRRDER